MSFWQAGASPSLPRQHFRFQRKIWPERIVRSQSSSQKGTGSIAEPWKLSTEGTLQQEKAPALPALLPLISHSPSRAHSASLSSSSRKLCTVLGLWVQGKERLSEEAAYHPCSVWQSVTSVQPSSLPHEHKCSAVLWLHYPHLEHAIQAVSARRRLSA